MFQYWIVKGIIAVSQFLDTPYPCDCLGWLLGFSYLQPQSGEQCCWCVGTPNPCILASKRAVVLSFSRIWNVSAAASAVFSHGTVLLSFCKQAQKWFFFLIMMNFKKSTQWLFPPHWYLSWTVNCLSSLLAVSFFLLVASLPTHVFASSNSEPFACMTWVLKSFYMWTADRGNSCM